MNQGRVFMKATDTKFPGSLKLSGLILLFLQFMVIFGFTQITSTFDTADTLDGWRAVGDGSYSYEEATGNPGNCMRIDDDATGNLLFALAPSKFLGDWSIGTTDDSLTADIFLHNYGGSYFAPEFIFRISGPGGRAIALSGSAYEPPTDTWVHFAVGLDSTQWNVQQGSWKALIKQVSMLEILTEYITGDEFVRLDNPTLSFSPAISVVTPPVYSEFDDGAWDGWTFSNTGSVSIQNSGGNPDGYVRIGDANSVISHAYASTKFLGDWSGLLNNAAIQLDLIISSHSGDFLANHELLRLSGPGGAAILPMDSTLLKAEGRWKSFSYLLDPNIWTLESGTWTGLLANVTDVSIFPEFYDGGETIGLDNFRLSNDAPEPLFEADPVFVFLGDTVKFYDHSKYVPDSRQWSFGDGSESQEENPVHYYDIPGTYDVQLSVTNEFGTNNLLIPDLVEVAGISDSILFFDDFDNDTIHPAWRFINGTWSESGGIMRQTSNYYSGDYLGGAYAIVGSSLWTNYTLSADLNSADNDKIGFVFRYQDAKNFYLFTWQQEGSLRAIKKFVEGVGTDLATDNVPYDMNTWYHFTMVTDDSVFKCYIDSSLVFETVDSTFATGKAGLYCHGNTGSYWDNFSVVQTHFVPTAIKTGGSTIISSVKLYQNYPNPFNPLTDISYTIPTATTVRISVFNITGQKVADLVNSRQSAGTHRLTWDASAFPSGVYFIRLQANGSWDMKKCVLLK